ncbi:MAG TPA: DnaJ domain-containing protein [Vicinamibacterales bacterium]|nr:DnaJ domain-containing protein [Vicinamibacterales bacterium]
MHDYFEILGVSPDARARDIQRACRRRVPVVHPDFCAEPDAAGRPLRDAAIDRETAAADLVDVAVDFVDMASVVNRMQIAFFGTTR